MMSQGRALRIPDREKTAGFNGRQREKKTEPGKGENKAGKGLGKEKETRGKRKTLGRKKRGNDSSGEDRQGPVLRSHCISD